MTVVQVKVIPKSGRSSVKIEGKTLKVWLKSAPEDGKANDELVRTLADKYDVPLSRIHILRGKSSKNKLVDIVGVSGEEIEKIL